MQLKKKQHDVVKEIEIITDKNEETPIPAPKIVEDDFEQEKNPENDEEPNDQLDPERVQDFAANASYFKVSRFPGTPRGQ